MKIAVRIFFILFLTLLIISIFRFLGGLSDISVTGLVKTLQGLSRPNVSFTSYFSVGQDDWGILNFLRDILNGLLNVFNLIIYLAMLLVNALTYIVDILTYVFA